MLRAYKNDKVYMEFSRLAINDLSEDGMQPFFNGSSAFMCNGEMYNHEQYAETPGVSDCLTLFKLVREVGAFEACKIIKGSEFAFVYYDGEHLFVARDPIGVRPLFYTFFGGSIAFASEMKALLQFNNDIFVFPPGHVYCTGTEHFGCFYTIYWTIPRAITPKADLKSVLIECVRDRVKSTHRDIGFLLSGGLDSSLICSIACGLMTPSQRERVQTFTIGEHGSPDVVAAQEVANYLGTKHTHVPFNFKEAFKLVPKVISSIESYDTTTIRASIGNYLIGKFISKNSESKVIFNGDGSDELFGGYLYMNSCPNDIEFDKETRRLLNDIHLFDVLRSDKSISSNGLEPRTPFLDRSFVNYVLSIPPYFRNHNNFKESEKYLLRKSFDCKYFTDCNGRNILPDEILFRKKEAFSDGVSSHGRSLYQILQEKIAKKLNEQNESYLFEANIETEKMYYKNIFKTFFPNCQDILPYFWMPKYTNASDPSARTLDIYEKNV
jgi:asparagine synthase (glutamine-hydrolysing)